jgi:hypothetical protein
MRPVNHPFSTGRRVHVAGFGEGSVAYCVNSPSDLATVLRVSVILDAKRARPGYAGSIFPREQVRPILSAGSGYSDCACRDCFDIAITSDGSPAFCTECEEAGCEPDQDCQQPGAYGAEEEL